MKTFALRFMVAVLTFIVGTAVASLWAPRQYRMPEKPRKRCSASVVQLAPPTVFSVPPTLAVPPPNPSRLV